VPDAMQSTARKSLVSVSYDNSSLITLMTSAAAAAADDDELNSRCLVYSRQRQYTAVHQRTILFYSLQTLRYRQFFSMLYLNNGRTMQYLPHVQVTKVDVEKKLAIAIHQFPSTD